MARRKDLEDHAPLRQRERRLRSAAPPALTGEHEYERRAVGVLMLLHKVAAKHASAFSHLLLAIDFHLAAVKEVALAGAADGVPLLEGRTPVDGKAAAYVCERFACNAPVTDPDELAALRR